jgi:hypothetical protein
VCTPVIHVLQLALPDVVAMQTRQASLEGTVDLVRADGYPPHADRFEQAGYVLMDLLADGHDEER